METTQAADQRERTPQDERWWPSRYGAGDELGALNEITPAKLVAATRLVREGRIFDLGRVLDAQAPSFGGRYWRQTLLSSAHSINPRRPGGRPTGWGANAVNWVTELVTGTLQIGTHLDGLNHLQMGNRFYNGWTMEEIVEEWGTNRLGIETVPPIITRGLLADVARYRGVERLEAGEVITPKDLEGALGAAGLAAEPGDVLLVHTGWGRFWDEDPARYTSGEPGVGLAAAEWLAERRVALSGADTWSYGPVPGEDAERPFLVPQLLNVKYGVFIMENLDLAELAEAGAYEFLFVLTHHKTRGSTATGIAPAAII
jgi:kynurenine formamidase